MGATNAVQLATNEGARLSTGLTNTIRKARTQLVSLLPGWLALAGGAVVTWICFNLGTNLAPVGFLYLVFVVLAAVYGGFWQATLISVASLDYFFDDPIVSFSVERVSNWLELGVFEFTALMITQLSNRAQLRAL